MSFMSKKSFSASDDLTEEEKRKLEYILRSITGKAYEDEHEKE